MSLLNFYIILIIVGILLDVLVLVLVNNQGTTEQMAVCFIVAVLCLIFGIRGVAGQLKAYM